MLPMGTLLSQGREESEIVTVAEVKHTRAHLSIKLGNSARRDSKREQGVENIMKYINNYITN